MKLTTAAFCMIALGLLASAAAHGQDAAAPGDANAHESEAHVVGDRPPFTPEELEQMLAAIALYPDALLTQILMASTYPIEVVEAERWVKKNQYLKGDALAKELEKQSWDPSVRSLVSFPEILTMMSEQIGTTVRIGDAFIGQQDEVMATVQTLRAKAKAEGNLTSTDEQKVSTQMSDAGTEIIVIESSSPDVIYVPQYDPVVIYGGWPYPSYPPYPYHPYYPVATPLISFGVGVACGVAWGYAWGDCDWHSGDVDIDIDQNFEFNSEINRESFKQELNNRQTSRDRQEGDRRADGVQSRGQGTWQHDPSHRQGVSYRNRDSASKVGAATTSDRATQARSEYRGRAEAGRRDIAAGATDSRRGASPSDRSTGGSRDRDSSTRSGASSAKGGAFNDSRSSGSSTRAASNRGSTSRSSSPSMSRSSGSRPSGSVRSGGRAGGGRGGGRR